MISCQDFVDTLVGAGWRTATGVPCSTFSGPIEHYTAQGAYHPAANEGVAVAVAAGAALGGARRLLIAQNSGLGNMINPLATLCAPYRIPVLIAMSLRGWPDPAGDEPQHAISGPRTAQVLRQAEVEPIVLDGTLEHLAAGLARARERYRDRLSTALLVPRGTVGEHGSSPAAGEPPAAAMTSREAAETVAGWAEAGTVIVSTTGYLSRFLFAAGDRPANLYLQGSMGHAGAVAAGLAHSRPESPVVVLDGDGAFVMHLGAMGSVLALGGPNLIHVVVVNGAYQSTGGQRSPSGDLDLAAIAGAAGYRTVRSAGSATELAAALAAARGLPGPHAIVVVADDSAGAAAPPRASGSVGLSEIADRFALHEALAGGRR